MAEALGLLVVIDREPSLVYCSPSSVFEKVNDNLLA